MKIARHRLVAENLNDLYKLVDSVIQKTKLEYPKLSEGHLKCHSNPI